MTVINLSRPEAAKMTQEFLDSIDNSAPWAWIKIEEPDDIFEDTKYDFSNCPKIPRLEIAFWDTEILKPMVIINGEDKLFQPPSAEDARKIKEFLDKYYGWNIVVNCRAGISRSGAVAYYLNKHSYRWPEQYQKRVKYNKVLARLLDEIYEADNRRRA